MSCKLKKNIDVILLFVVCMSFFLYVIMSLNSDITVHIEQVMKINASEVSYPPNFIFYFTINFLSAFCNIEFILIAASSLLLAIATVAKYAISKSIIKSQLVEIKDANNYKIIVIALSLFFCFAIPDPYAYFVLQKMYLGRLVPMVWHNSTVILLFPFALLLYWKQLKFFDKNYKTTAKDILIVNGLVILNILIKPSFIFVYLPITFFFLLDRFKTDRLKIFLLNLTPLLTGGLFIIGQYYLIYKMQQGSFQSDASSIAISYPFEVTLLWFPAWYIPIAYLLSLALPIFTIIFFRDVFKHKPFKYAFALTILGLVISTFIIETGPRMAHGNFTWQNVVCAFLLMLATVSFLVPKFVREEKKTKKMKFLIALFFIHSLSGILYLLKYSVSGEFY